MLNLNYMEIYMEEHQIKKYRYERKYIIEFNFLPLFLSQLYSSGFSEPYNKRRVNNIYLDDYNFSSLNDNFDGLTQRSKYRIRWYSEQFGSSNKTLEVKYKNEFLNTKKHVSLDILNLSSLNNINEFYQKILQKLKKQNNYNVLGEIINKKPTLLNSYARMYFENQYKDIRVTIDNDLFYYSPITTIKYKEKFIIVEVKYNKEIKFLNNFKNLSFTRYSKYVKGTSQTTFSNTVY